MITYVGEINLGGLTPMSVSVAASLTAAINLDLAGLASLTADLTITPPSLTGDISALVALIASLNAAISVGLPSIDFQATAVAQAIAELTAELSVPLAFQALLGGGAGIYAYAYEGVTSAFGAAVDGALASGWPDGTAASANANALIMATLMPTVWVDVLTFFGAVPPSLPPGLTYIAQANIGSLCPTVVTATVDVIASLQARLDGLLALAIQLSIHPPSFSTSLSLALDLKAAIQAALSLNLPGLSFQLDALARLVASLNAKLDALAALAITLGGAAGLFVYTYAGTGAALGGEITAALASGWPDGSGPTAIANALVLGTVSPAVWVTIETFFGGI